MPIAYDESRFPLLNTIWTGEPTVDDAVEFTSWMTKNFAHKKPFAVIVNVTGAKSPSAKVLTIIADFAKANVENDRKYVLGFSYAVSSVIVRTVIKGFLALQPPTAATTIHADAALAEAWAKARLAERGLKVS